MLTEHLLCTCVFLCVMYWPFLYPRWNVSANSSPFFDRVLCLIKLWEFFRYSGSNVLLDTCLASTFPCLWLDFPFYFFNGSACSFKEKAMATHSSTLAWKITWTEEPGGLQSLGLLRVRHDWATSLSLFTFMHWRRKWQPTPVFLPGESQGWGSPVGCRLWGRTESDTTKVT